MNKYTETYIDELQKNAFIGRAMGAAFQAAKPIVAQGVKDTLKSLGKNTVKATKTTASGSKSIGTKALEFTKGVGSGISTLSKDYLNVLKTPGASPSQKVLGIIGQTLSTPGKMIGQKPISQIGMREAGQLAGAATPLVAAGAGIYSLMPNQDLPRVPASRATFLPSHEESQYFADLWKKRTGDNLSQREIDIATLRK
jgi:hypothetical protein